ncbi:MAG: efflux RND transporter periplasmic adaptor subunit [Candidatus Roizmanbacteria bacterium]|nr:efflux RND transporter periplasmic adaptor subunit [Candidatus Roizmanbacteria bacterium]
MEKIRKVKKSVKRYFTVKWIGVAILVVGVLFFAYKKYITNNEIVFSTYTVKRETLQDILSLTGEVDATEKISLHFQTGGRLSWIGVKEGDTVKKYQGIASLDARQLQKTLEKYLNTYSKERRDFEQSTTDNDELAIALSTDIRDRAKRTLENAQFDLNNSVLDVELQSIAKEYSLLYSPIDGIVTRLDATEPGMNVSITDTYQIINPASILFSVSADQTEVIDLQEGEGGTITFDAYPDTKISGTISSIGYTPKPNETGTVYEVKMLIDGSDMNKYRLGMTGDVDFIIREIQNVVVVPIEYIQDENDKQYVNKKVNGKSQKTFVIIGNEYGGKVEIRGGLSAGDEIYEIK